MNIPERIKTVTRSDETFNILSDFTVKVTWCGSTRLVSVIPHNNFSFKETTQFLYEKTKKNEWSSTSQLGQLCDWLETRETEAWKKLNIIHWLFAVVIQGVISLFCAMSTSAMIQEMRKACPKNIAVIHPEAPPRPTASEPVPDKPPTMPTPPPSTSSSSAQASTIIPTSSTVTTVAASSLASDRRSIPIVHPPKVPAATSSERPVSVQVSDTTPSTAPIDPPAVTPSPEEVAKRVKALLEKLRTTREVQQEDLEFLNSVTAEIDLTGWIFPLKMSHKKWDHFKTTFSAGEFLCHITTQGMTKKVNLQLKSADDRENLNSILVHNKDNPHYTLEECEPPLLDVLSGAVSRTKWFETRPKKWLDKLFVKNFACLDTPEILANLQVLLSRGQHVHYLVQYYPQIRIRPTSEKWDKVLRAQPVAMLCQSFLNSSQFDFFIEIFTTGGSYQIKEFQMAWNREIQRALQQASTGDKPNRTFYDKLISTIMKSEELMSLIAVPMTDFLRYFSKAHPASETTLSKNWQDAIILQGPQLCRHFLDNNQIPRFSATMLIIGESLEKEQRELRAHRGDNPQREQEVALQQRDLKLIVEGAFDTLKGTDREFLITTVLTTLALASVVRVPLLDLVARFVEARGSICSSSWKAAMILQGPLFCRHFLEANQIPYFITALSIIVDNLKEIREEESRKIAEQKDVEREQAAAKQQEELASLVEMAFKVLKGRDRDLLIAAILNSESLSEIVSVPLADFRAHFLRAFTDKTLFMSTTALTIKPIWKDNITDQGIPLCEALLDEVGPFYKVVDILLDSVIAKGDKYPELRRTVEQALARHQTDQAAMHQLIHLVMNSGTLKQYFEHTYSSLDTVEKIKSFLLFLSKQINPKPLQKDLLNILDDAVVNYEFIKNMEAAACSIAGDAWMKLLETLSSMRAVSDNAIAKIHAYEFMKANPTLFTAPQSILEGLQPLFLRYTQLGYQKASKFIGELILLMPITQQRIMLHSLLRYAIAASSQPPAKYPMCHSIIRGSYEAIFFQKFSSQTCLPTQRFHAMFGVLFYTMCAYPDPKHQTIIKREFIDAWTNVRTANHTSLLSNRVFAVTAWKQQALLTATQIKELSLGQRAIEQEQAKPKAETELPAWREKHEKDIAEIRDCYSQVKIKMKDDAPFFNELLKPAGILEQGIRRSIRSVIDAEPLKAFQIPLQTILERLYPNDSAMLFVRLLAQLNLMQAEMAAIGAAVPRLPTDVCKIMSSYSQGHGLDLEMINSVMAKDAPKPLTEEFLKTLWTKNREVCHTSLRL